MSEGLARWLQVCGLCLALSGCLGAPDGIESVRNFDLDRYLGSWYEIARLNHRFKQGLTQVTATYSPRAEGGVTVVNRGFNTDKNAWEEADGKAYPVGDPTVGELKVSFFGPFYGGYNIIDLDQEDYRYAMVAGPTRSYLWILARDPALDPATLDRLVEKARALGFDTRELIYVEH